MVLEHARSVLFVPGDRPERFAKAMASGADAVIFDVEDAVRPEAKAAARVAIAAFAETCTPGSILVRINAAEAPGHQDDLALCRHAAVGAVVLPKTESARGVDAVGQASCKPVWCIVETARGLTSLGELANAPATRRIILGTIDLALDLGIALGTGAANRVLDQARYHVVVASRSALRAPPIDGVHTDIKDADGLMRAATDARNGGFGGMLCIHPSQCAGVNRAFSPSDAERAWAARVIAAAEHSPGAFQLDGQMIDAPVIARARRTLAHPET